MASLLTEPLVVIGIALGTAGIALLVQSRIQVRMLRRRVASGAGTAVIDPATGLFSAAAAWQSIRGEANRARRLQRPLDVWIGIAASADDLDHAGRALIGSMPDGATGVRVARDRVCVVSCSGGASPMSLPIELDWHSRRFEPGEDSAVQALAFLSEVAA